MVYWPHQWSQKPHRLSRQRDRATSRTGLLPWIRSAFSCRSCPRMNGKKSNEGSSMSSPVTEARIVKSLPRRVVDAAVEGVGFALVLWLVITVLPEPPLAQHRLTDYLIWTGMIFALGR